MSQKNFKGIILGAMLGTMVGSASAIFMQKNVKDQIRSFGESAQEAVDGFFNWSSRKDGENTTFAKGAVLGLLVGAGSALLFTPTTGKKLRQNISHTYQEMAEKAQELLAREEEFAHAAAEPVKRVVRSVAKKATVPAKRKVHNGHR